MDSTCFNCQRSGHWAKECPLGACPKCQVRLDLHTQAGMVECAWRGCPCTNCGCPPHPDSTRAARSLTLNTPSAEFCRRYEHPDDSEQDRGVRALTDWHRDADPGTFYRSQSRRLAAL